MTGLVVRRVKNERALKLVPVVPGPISGGIVNLERVQVICPACGQQVEAVARDGRVKGYCTVARQYVDFLIETQLEGKKPWQDPEYRAKQRVLIVTAETRAKMSAAHTGKHPTAETRAKISVALKRRHNKRGE
ncbi:hypothetical protein ES703_91304 [subsurface metagenome]